MFKLINKQFRTFTVRFLLLLIGAVLIGVRKNRIPDDTTPEKSPEPASPPPPIVLLSESNEGMINYFYS